jgi:hypothetical protein
MLVVKQNVNYLIYVKECNIVYQLSIIHIQQTIHFKVARSKCWNFDMLRLCCACLGSGIGEFNKRCWPKIRFFSQQHCFPSEGNQAIKISHLVNFAIVRVAQEICVHIYMIQSLLIAKNLPILRKFSNAASQLVELPS